MIRRFGAYFIDWYLVMVIMNVFLLVAAYVVTGSLYVGSLPLVFFKPELRLPLLGILIAIEFVFYVCVPRFVWRGQTIGKRLLRLRVVSLQGNDAGIVRLAVRDMVGVVLLEGCFSPLSNYVRNYLMLFVGRDVIEYTVWFSWAAGAVSILVLLVTKRRMLHDFIAGTAVVLAADELVPESANVENGEEINCSQ